MQNARIAIQAIAGASLLFLGASCCKTLTSGKGTPDSHHAVQINLPEENVAVFAGQTVNLSVQPAPLTFHYQWQKNGEDLKGETRRNLTLREVRLEDTGLYRCLVLRTGEFGETNQTVEFALTVNYSIRLAMTIPTTGIFQPGTTSPIGSGCVESGSFSGYVRFKSAVDNSYWWTPTTSTGGAATKGTVVYNGTTPTTSQVKIDVLESGTLRHYCSSLTSTGQVVNFPVRAGSKYQIVLFVMKPTTLPTGASVKVDISWE